jgi:hypothetical protein
MRTPTLSEIYFAAGSMLLGHSFFCSILFFKLSASTAGTVAEVVAIACLVVGACALKKAFDLWLDGRAGRNKTVL